jgi:hypothetical protein
MYLLQIYSKHYVVTQKKSIKLTDDSNPNRNGNTFFYINLMDHTIPIFHREFVIFKTKFNIPKNVQ